MRINPKKKAQIKRNRSNEIGIFEILQSLLAPAQMHKRVAFTPKHHLLHSCLIEHNFANIIAWKTKVNAPLIGR